MLGRTHLAIGLFFILAFISFVEHKISFILIVFFATLIPDVDSEFSLFGRLFILRPFQFFVKHRDFLHSFSFLILISIFFVLFLPIVAFPFFLGFSAHLLADSFTKEGIKFFYPLKKKSCGKVVTGGKSETSVFVLFLFLDLLLLVNFLL